MNKFRARHCEISLRKPENTFATRSFGFSRSAVNEFYDLLQSLLDRFKFTPNRIFNIDQTGITTIMSMPKVLAPLNIVEIMESFAYRSLPTHHTNYSHSMSRYTDHSNPNLKYPLVIGIRTMLGKPSRFITLQSSPKHHSIRHSRRRT